MFASCSQISLCPTFSMKKTRISMQNGWRTCLNFTTWLYLMLHLAQCTTLTTTCAQCRLTIPFESSAGNVVKSGNKQRKQLACRHKTVGMFLLGHRVPIPLRLTPALIVLATTTALTITTILMINDHALVPATVNLARALVLAMSLALVLATALVPVMVTLATALILAITALVLGLAITAPVLVLVLAITVPALVLAITGPDLALAITPRAQLVPVATILALSPAPAKTALVHVLAMVILTAFHNRLRLLPLLSGELRLQIRWQRDLALMTRKWMTTKHRKQRLRGHSRRRRRGFTLAQISNSSVALPSCFSPMLNTFLLGYFARHYRCLVYCHSLFWTLLAFSASSAPARSRSP
ncbi:hypothetical protein CPC08DRAFT_821321 [Agrocybe pediades]|nr:hypothetical protein CPC08DRAFT_821321 [Agrocybe pediades]